MDKKLYTKIKTDQGIVRIPQDDIELQKVASLIYSMNIEIDQLKAQLEKMKNCENCKHRTVKFIAVACRLTDSTDMPDYVCDKWKMMK